jgi:hypothetical protein
VPLAETQRRSWQAKRELLSRRRSGAAKDKHKHIGEWNLADDCRDAGGRATEIEELSLRHGDTAKNINA